MSMTNRREPRERPDRLANRNHILATTNRTPAINPYPLDNRSSIWATRGSRASRRSARERTIAYLSRCAVARSEMG